MSFSRFYVPFNLDIGQSVTLPEDTAHHLSRVLRLGTGDSIVLFNGEGGEFICTIEAMAKKSISVCPVDFLSEDRSAALSQPRK